MAEVESASSMAIPSPMAPEGMSPSPTTAAAAAATGETTETGLPEAQGSKDKDRGMDRAMDRGMCSTPGCPNAASLACPTCIKLELTPPSYFCSQECFKGYWTEHKKLHKQARPTQQDVNVIPFNTRNFTFTGPLRPFPRAPRRLMPSHIRKPDYADTGRSRAEQDDRRSNSTIKVYSAAEIEGMRRACAVGRAVLDEASSAVRVGITCQEIDDIVYEACIRRNSYPSPLNYNGFPKSVCTSVNEVICHGIPDTRPLEDGDIVNLDISVYVDGFHSDLNETFFVGNVDADGHRVVQTSYNCLAAAAEMIRPGTMYRELGSSISSVALANGCSVVKTYCGHGVGELFHTAPNIPHYNKNKAKGVMKAGHIFTIEPMINLGTWKDVLWPDDWTATTADGQRSAQFEHTFLVTETGYEILTGREGESVMQWDAARFQR